MEPGFPCPDSAAHVGVLLLGPPHEVVSDSPKNGDNSGMRTYLDGAILPVSEALPYFDSKIVGTDAGDKVINPRFEIGRVSDSVVKELERFIDGYDGKQKVLRVSGRSFKHIYERRGGLPATSWKTLKRSF